MLMDFQQLDKCRILLLGDLCEDIFVYGRCERLSPEAPVPVFIESHKNKMKGMSGNVYNNLCQFPVRVDFIYSGEGSTKTRYVDLKSSQHLIRIDNEKNFQPVILPNNLEIYDYIVISDYNKGSISQDVIQKLKSTGKCIFVDSKRKDLSIYEGCILKINEKEYRQSGLESNENMIITMGDRGALWGNKLFSTKKVEVRDVSGAGDTFFASFICAYIISGSFEESIDFANKCSLQVVQKSGTSILNLEELKNEICI